MAAREISKFFLKGGEKLFPEVVGAGLRLRLNMEVDYCKRAERDIRGKAVSPMF
jgi:hypothetical protein